MQKGISYHEFKKQIILSASGWYQDCIPNGNPKKAQNPQFQKTLRRKVRIDNKKFLWYQRIDQKWTHNDGDHQDQSIRKLLKINLRKYYDLAYIFY